MSLVSRYAPSPSGPLHLGNLRTALFAWLQARWSGAVFILRIDDLDIPRTVPGMVDQAIADLKWLGLDWDKGPDNKSNSGELEGSVSFFQSECNDFYHQAFAQLQQAGLVYKCFCSRKEWQAIASAPHGKTPIYPGTCRDPNPRQLIEQQQKLESGVQYSWRFRVEDKAVAFVDEILGRIEMNLAIDAGDFVVRRADGIFAYHLATVVDDARMKVSDVLRGEDLLDSVACQIALYQALEFQIPKYWHVPLVTDDLGNRLAKRDGSNGIEQMRAQGCSRADILKSMFEGIAGIEDIDFHSPTTILESWSLNGMISSFRGNSRK